jgi:hypothetical protein
MANFPGAVYIGRANGRKGLKASPLQNTFVIGRDGTREEVIDDFQTLFTSKVEKGFPEIINALIDARGKPLACWCRKSTQRGPACHGDVILELLAQYTDEHLVAMIGGR